MAEPTFAALLPGDPRRVGRWKIDGRLGAGGMGVVLVGTAADRSRAAIKLIHPGLASDPAFRARFRREVALSERVGGPHVARVLGSDPDADHPWLAIEYVSGPDLATAIRRDGPLEDAPLRAFAVATALALRQIHAAGVVHRDFKPSNVILTRDSPIVIDFGIAAAVDSTSLTTTGALLGSVGWMAPEQLRGEPAGARADVFGWAATVAFAATGRPPFGAGAPQTVMYRVLHEAPDLVGIRGDVERACVSALAKSPEERPSLDEVLRGLGAASEADAETIIGSSWTLVAETSLFATTPLANRTHRKHRRSWLGLVAASVIAFVAVTVAGVRSTPRQRAASPSATTGEPVTSTALATTTTRPGSRSVVAPGALGGVDWANRTYEVDCGGDVARYELVDGQYGRRDSESAYVRMFDVYYADFDRDGTSEATVDLGCTVGASTVTEQIILFKSVSGSPMRFGGAITAEYIERDGNEFIAYDSEYSESDPRCCPSHTRISRYRYDAASSEGFDLYKSDLVESGAAPELKPKF